MQDGTRQLLILTRFFQKMIWLLNIDYLNTLPLCDIWLQKSELWNSAHHDFEESWKMLTKFNRLSTFGQAELPILPS